ncbi:MAG: hypothetical protein ACYTHJ_05395 [Planctomycetota bacterium]
MISLAELWLPILVSAVFVFVTSSIFHMVIPTHRKDYEELPNEDKALEGMREQAIAPGSYCFPFCRTMSDMGSEGMLEKYNRGPVGFMTILPSGPPAMGKSLIQWFLMSVVLNAFAAYMGTIALTAGAEYSAVFRVIFVAAVLGYAGNTMSESIWKGQRWSVTLKFVFDGVVYALVTAGTFGWLWPDAVVALP